MNLIRTCSIWLALAMAPVLAHAAPVSDGADGSSSSSATAARAANQAKFCQQYRARLVAGNKVILKAEALCQSIGK